MTTNDAKGCERCRQRDYAVLREVHAESRDYHGGKALETTTYYVCTLCGGEWQHLEESGVGGHGSFWTLKKAGGGVTP